MLIILLNSIFARSSLVIQVVRLLRISLCALVISMVSTLSLANDSIDAAIESELEAQMEDEVEVQVEEEVEGQVEEEVEGQVEDEVEAQVEDEVEGQVEDEVEGQVEDEVEGQVEDEVEGQVEDEVEGQVEDEVEGHVEDEMEGTVEDEVEGRVEDHVERESDVEEIEDELDIEKIEPSEKISNQVEQGIERKNKAASELKSPDFTSRSSVAIEQLTDRAIEIIEEKAGSRRIAGELLILTDGVHLKELEKQGVEITDVVELNGLNQFLVEVKESSTKIPKNEITNLQYNHVYTLQSDQVEAELGVKKQGVATKQWELADRLSKYTDLLFESPVKIGVIDSGVDLNHEAFKSAKIQAESFFAGSNPIPKNHGTAIASLLVGNSEQMRGLIPSAEVYSANVFFSSQDNKQYASVKSLILALNWMVENHVEVINMSLSGPANPILEKTLAEVKSKGILLLAAAGNNGPVGAPAYPAAYDGVIAVTAVNHNNFAYFNANRGAYIDVAALGVDVFHATPDNQYESSTGTSFAVPFVTAISATLVRIYKTNNIEDILFQSALDLGEKGKDIVYGYGLVQLNTENPIASELNNTTTYQEVASKASDSYQ